MYACAPLGAFAFSGYTNWTSFGFSVYRCPCECMCVCVCVYKQSNYTKQAFSLLCGPKLQNLRPPGPGYIVLPLLKKTTTGTQEQHCGFKNCLFQLQKQADICNEGCDVTHTTSESERLATRRVLASHESASCLLLLALIYRDGTTISGGAHVFGYCVYQHFANILASKAI